MPWWGGEIECMIDLVKTANASLAFNEVKEVILNVEVALKDSPLSYICHQIH